MVDDFLKTACQLLDAVLTIISVTVIDDTTEPSLYLGTIVHTMRTNLLGIENPNKKRFSQHLKVSGFYLYLPLWIGHNLIDI